MHFQRGIKKKLGIVRIPRLWALYVGLAGFVAEQIDSGASEPWDVADSFWFAQENGEFSETDIGLMQLSGSTPKDRWIAITMVYLKRFGLTLKMRPGCLNTVLSTKS